MSGGKRKAATQKQRGKYTKQFDRTAANKRRTGITDKKTGKRWAGKK